MTLCLKLLLASNFTINYGKHGSYRCCTNLFIFVAPADTIDGGHWTLVRHVPAGGVWHKATDQLRGTDVYGTPCGPTCKQEWSIRFDNKKFNQFLFALGDEHLWLIASKDAVTGSYYTNVPRTIYKSSINPNSYTAKWWRRSGVLHDPWIALEDRTDGNVIYLYVGNHLTREGEPALPHEGANVFVRWHGMIYPFSYIFLFPVMFIWIFLVMNS